MLKHLFSLIAIMSVLCAHLACSAMHHDPLTQRLMKVTGMNHTAPLFKTLHHQLSVQAKENQEIVLGVIEYAHTFIKHTANLSTQNIDVVIGDAQMLFNRVPAAREWLYAQGRAKRPGENTPEAEQKKDGGRNVGEQQEKRTYICVIPYSMTKHVTSQEKIVTIWLGMQAGGWSYFCERHKKGTPFMDVARQAVAAQTFGLLSFDPKSIRPTDIIKITQGHDTYFLHFVAILYEPTMQDFEEVGKRRGVAAHALKIWHYDVLREFLVSDLMRGEVKNIDRQFAAMLQEEAVREMLESL